jgi:hypothetical protein
MGFAELLNPSYGSLLVDPVIASELQNSSRPQNRSLRCEYGNFRIIVTIKRVAISAGPPRMFIA